MEILKTINLSKIYGEGDNQVKASDEINLSIDKGEFVAIVGSSGSGKSTLLHMLGCLDKPTSGEIYIEGENVATYGDDALSIVRRRKIGFVFQAYNLIPVMTVRENIEMPVLLDGKKPDKKYIDDLIDMLGLADRVEHLPNQLSGGQQQRVSIARALANKPSIILADEPTGNLDKKNSIEVMEILKASAKKYEQTLILITHEASVANLADRIIELSDGKIISDSKENA